MSDHLIWRLRNNDTAKHLCGLAADEIERMRLALLVVRASAGWQYMSDETKQIVRAASHPEPAPMRSERSERATPNET